MSSKLISKLESHHIETLRRWIEVHGRQWKRELRQAWFTGRYNGLMPGRDNDEAHLQNLRYRIGPSGLDKITTKQITG